MLLAAWGEQSALATEGATIVIADTAAVAPTVRRTNDAAEPPVRHDANSISRMRADANNRL